MQSNNENIGKLFKIVPFKNIGHGLAIKDVYKWKSDYLSLNTDQIIQLPIDSIVMWLGTKDAFVEVLYIDEILYMEPHFLKEIVK